MRGRSCNTRCGPLFPLPGLPLDIVELVFNHAAEIGRGAAEFSQGASQRAGEFRELLWAKDHEGNQENDDPVRESKQIYSLPCRPRILITGRGNSSYSLNAL